MQATHKRNCLYAVFSSQFFAYECMRSHGRRSSGYAEKFFSEPYCTWSFTIADLMEKNPSFGSERTVQTLVFQKFFWNHRSCLQLLFS